MRRSFIGRSSSGPWTYQPLRAMVGATLDTSLRPPCPRNTKTDLTRKSVGCTTRSASTLSAQFRWWHQRVRAFP
jgi:hypothetical protein